MALFVCDIVFLQQRGAAANEPPYCIGCEELDSDNVKDDPAVSVEAARAQALEASTQEPKPSASASPLAVAPLPPAVRQVQSLAQSSVSHVANNTAASEDAIDGSSARARLSVSREMLLSTLLNEMEWSANQLRLGQQERMRCADGGTVSERLHLVNLMRQCSETMRSLSDLSLPPPPPPPTCISSSK